MDNSDGTDPDKNWFGFTIAFVDKLGATGNQDWSALSVEEQELAALGHRMLPFRSAFRPLIC